MNAARRGRGEGNIRQLPSGRFKARMSFIDAAGQRRQPTATFATKREAQAWLRGQLASIDKGTFADSGKRTVGAWLDEWLVLKKPQVEPRTYSPWEQHVRLHLKPVLERLPLGKLKPAHVAKLYSELEAKGMSAAMRKKVGNTLTMALTDASKMQYINGNPATAVRKPKSSKPEIRPLNPEQTRAFLAATESDRLHALFVLAIDAGMRQGELFALCWPEVDFDAGAVSVVRSLEDDAGKLRVKDVKSKSSRRRVRLSDPTVAALADHRRQLLADGLYKPDGLVFPDSEGNHLRRPNVLRRSFFPALKRAGLSAIRFHDLRHTCATLLLLNGINVKAVSTRLGHSTVTLTLDTYSHVLPQMEEQTCGVMKGLLRTGTG